MIYKRLNQKTKIVIVGAGVIGSTYGWQLSKTDCEITHLVRAEKLNEYKTHGMLVRCLDLRGSRRRQIEEKYHPIFFE